MDLGAIPIELSRLTDLEKILIIRIHQVMSVYHAKGKQYKYNDNVINFAQDRNLIARVLLYNLVNLSTIFMLTDQVISK